VQTAMILKKKAESIFATCVAIRYPPPPPKNLPNPQKDSRFGSLCGGGV